MKKCLTLMTAAFLWIMSCTGHVYKVPDEKVTLHLELPNVQQVYFASSLDDYRLQKANKMKSNRWEIAVPAHTEFRYFFLVDGSVYLPDCEYKETDDFGSENCIFVPKP